MLEEYAPLIRIASMHTTANVIRMQMEYEIEYKWRTMTTTLDEPMSIWIYLYGVQTILIHILAQVVL
jgi:hypothetical protein